MNHHKPSDLCEARDFLTVQWLKSGQSHLLCSLWRLQEALQLLQCLGLQLSIAVAPSLLLLSLASHGFSPDSLYLYSPLFGVQ